MPANATLYERVPPLSRATAFPTAETTHLHWITPQTTDDADGKDEDTVAAFIAPIWHFCSVMGC